MSEQTMKRPTPKWRKEQVFAEWLGSLSAEEVLRRLGTSGKDGFYQHEREWVFGNLDRWEHDSRLLDLRWRWEDRKQEEKARRTASAALQKKCLLGGATGDLRCSCGQSRYPGCDVCPQCGFGENFDPVAHAQAEKRAELVRAGKEDPREVSRLVSLALNYARWLVDQGYVGWPLAYKRAARKYGVSERAIRSLGAQRAARSR
jgi:hypothetical protein